jgi:DNA-binding transcriptional ArsR family regulator
MPNSLDASKCSRFLKALGDPLRMQIVECLQDGPKTVTEIAEYLEIEISNASHHLHVLSHADLVMTERDGKFCYYSLASDILIRGSAKSPSSLEFGCCRLELGRKKQNRTR